MATSLDHRSWACDAVRSLILVLLQGNVQDGYLKTTDQEEQGTECSRGCIEVMAFNDSAFCGAVRLGRVDATFALCGDIVQLFLRHEYFATIDTHGQVWLESRTDWGCVHGIQYVSTTSLCVRQEANKIIGVGSFCSVFLCGFGLDRIYIRLRGSDDANGKPEYRLPLCIFGAFALPFSITAYGWIAEYRLPAPLLLACVSLLGFTLLSIMIPLSAYVVDACGLYSASAMTGVIVTRCLAGTFLPLGVAPLVEKLGYGWGFTCLGVLSLSLAIFPVLILKYGSRWRQYSEFTKDM